MRKNILFITFILIFSISAFAQNIQILETGGFHGEEVSAKTGEIWLGLYKTGETYTLLPSVLTVDYFHDAIIDNDENEKTGKEVKVLGRENPVFLIKGKGFKQSRVVKTVYSDLDRIENDFDKTFDFAGEKYNLKVESEKTDKDYPKNLNETSKLVLTKGKTTQILYSVERCSDCYWQMNFVGDLDNDGKLDFYLYLTDHYNVANLKLFLSSEAERGKLVKEVAEFTTTGC
jgi:hypothetical protein